MNEHKVLIYHYSSKNRKWYDATNSVLWYGDNKKAWRVLFVNSKRYFYVSFSNMKIYDPQRFSTAAGLILKWFSLIQVPSAEAFLMNLW